MGNLCTCFCTDTKTNYKKLFAIKLPHGIEFIQYNNNTFEKNTDINVFIQNLYCVSQWTNWIVYNDDISSLNYNNKHNRKGHCKGILSWSKNNNKIGWLCHSVPNFPRLFNGLYISKIEDSEKMYGQSFQYIEIEYDENILYDIIKQIHIMESNIYIDNSKYKNMIFPKVDKINMLKINEDIIHYAKPPNDNVDIYNYIASIYKYNWKIETWKRGHLIEEKNDHIIDTKEIIIDNIHFKSSQDHSKWAVSDDEYYWIGDLNRMSSQFKRGGGGFICKDSKLTDALIKLI